MKKILLLGGFGFIGSNIMRYIDAHLLNTYKVVVFDRIAKHPYVPLNRCIEDVFTGDFCDANALRNILKKHKFDFVIHSISTTVPATSKDIRFDIESNLIPTVELLKLLVEYNSKNIIYLSSGGAVYGDIQEGRKHKENDKAMPLSSYGVVKLAIEKYLYQFYRNFGLQPTILRLSNPYGPLHYSDKQGVINIAVRAALNHKKFSIWGDGSAKKDYIFIEDFCLILMRLLENQPVNKTINIGSGEAITLNAIMGAVKFAIPHFEWSYDQSQEFDVLHFELDISQLKTIIPDLHLTSIEDGLLKTITWQKQEVEQHN